MKGSDFPLLLASEQLVLLGLASNQSPPSHLPGSLPGLLPAGRTALSRGVLPWGAEAMVTRVSVQGFTPSRSHCHLWELTMGQASSKISKDEAKRILLRHF